MTALFSVSDINTSINHEPRILDTKLAEALGFARPRKIRDVISRHLDALKRLGNIVCPAVGQTPKGGRPGKEYWLTKKQALFLCTKSETPNATEVTIQMVEVFDQVMNGKTVPVRAHTRRPPTKRQTLSPEEFAASIPQEDLLLTMQNYLTDAARRHDNDKGLQLAQACLTRFKHHLDTPITLSCLYRSNVKEAPAKGMSLKFPN
jgi:predicted ArsR family transcriptional regulator